MVAAQAPASLAESANEAFQEALATRDEMTRSKKAYNRLPGGRSFYEGTASIADVTKYGRQLNQALVRAEEAVRAGATRTQLADTISYARALTAGGMAHRIAPGMFDVSQTLESNDQLERLKALAKLKDRR
jgi:hypothetical protein